eukprot:COSAG01_NODE_817_length_13376_cov_2.970101_15_plen_164_part_00
MQQVQPPVQQPTCRPGARAPCSSRLHAGDFDLELGCPRRDQTFSFFDCTTTVTEGGSALCDTLVLGCHRVFFLFQLHLLSRECLIPNQLYLLRRAVGRNARVNHGFAVAIDIAGGRHELIGVGTIFHIYTCFRKKSSRRSHSRIQLWWILVQVGGHTSNTSPY